MRRIHCNKSYGNKLATSHSKQLPMAEIPKDINKTIRENIIDKNNGVCCYCKRRGVAVQVHHIDRNTENNHETNLAPLCAKHHDQYHRPDKYRGTKLDDATIINAKKHWEETVANCKTDNPQIFGLVCAFGTSKPPHTLRIAFLTYSPTKVVYERIFHITDHPFETWSDVIEEEKNWMGKNVKLVYYPNSLPVKHSAVEKKQLLPLFIMNKINGTILTATDWRDQSVANVYISPTQASITLIIYYRRDQIFRAHLHRCVNCLHYRNGNAVEQHKIDENNIKTQAIKIISDTIGQYIPGRIFFLTGSPDKPNLINHFHLPQIWETDHSHCCGKRPA